MKIVCGEAVSNIIRHAYDGKTDQPIFLEILLYPDFLEIRFKDMGKQLPINPGESKDTLFPYTTLFRSGSEERRVGKE